MNHIKSTRQVKMICFSLSPFIYRIIFFAQQRRLQSICIEQVQEDEVIVYVLCCKEKNRNLYITIVTMEYLSMIEKQNSN